MRRQALLGEQAVFGGCKCMKPAWALVSSLEQRAGGRIRYDNSCGDFAQVFRGDSPGHKT